MNFSYRPLNSKEYKLMLRPDEFTNISQGKENIINTIKAQIQKQEGIFNDADQDQDNRKVWYLDTNKLELNKDKHFLLRIREEYKNNGILKGYDVILKNRNDDRHKALTYDLSNPIENLNFKYEEFEFEYEEDILTPFHSKFSASTKFEFKQKPKLDGWQDILSVFPELKLGVSPTESLLRVNGFIAKEISYELGSIIFSNGNKAKTEISLWYLSNEEDKDFSLPFANKKPVIVEFDIGIKAKESSEDTGTLLDEFPQSFLEETKKFYMSLQKESIADLDTNKTKTEYAYEYVE